MAQELGFYNMKVYKNDAFTACKKLQGQKFDIIFADPPYNLERIDEIPAAIFDNELLAENGDCPLLNIRLKYLSIAIFILENTVNMEVSTFHFSDYKNARFVPGISTNFHH